MRHIFTAILLLCLAAPSTAETASYSEVGIFQDSFGSTASFWVATWDGNKVGVLKVRAHDKEGEANITLDAEGLKKLTEMARDLNQHNRKIKDKILVLDTQVSGESSVSAIIINVGGAQIKALQVKEGEQEHGFLWDKKTYSELKKLADKTRRKL